MTNELTILFVSEDPDIQEVVLPALKGEGRRVIVSEGLRNGLRHLSQGRIDILLVDGVFPAEGLHHLIREARASGFRTSIFAMSDVDHLPVKLEVDGILGRPPDVGRLQDLVSRTESRGKLLQKSQLLGHSNRMREVREKVEQIAPTDVGVLITGESGTGKDLVASAIHRLGRRSSKPFLVVNCGAIPETLLESELFGHERGAFTDARSQRKGHFESANGGTVFLDEIGEMSVSAQVKLLRVLEEREVTRLGSANPISVDVRILAATNKDLGRAVQGGEFRRDLYYRLNVVELKMPSLRDRPEDIPEYVEAFTEDFAKTHGIIPPRFDDEAIKALSQYSWPGNVRELKNLVERLIVLSKGSRLSARDIITHMGFSEDAASHERNLPVPLHKSPDKAQLDLIYWALLSLQKEIAEIKSRVMGNDHIDPESIGYRGSALPLAGGEIQVAEAAVTESEEGEDDYSMESINEVEWKHIRRVLQSVGGNRRQAAKILGIGERTLYRKIRDHE